MEGVPTNNLEQELSFDEKVALAETLFEAVNARNDFTERHGGFDDFADVHQHIGDNRKKFDEMEVVVTEARKEFDEKITDKKQFMEDLISKGDVDLANLISLMFNIPKRDDKSRGFISEILGKK